MLFYGLIGNMFQEVTNVQAHSLLQSMAVITPTLSRVRLGQVPMAQFMTLASLAER